MKKLNTIVFAFIILCCNYTSAQPCVCTITLNTTINPASCSGLCDGSIDLTASGCQSPYVYVWSNGASTEDQSGLCSGTYTVTVVDQMGCTATISCNVYQTLPPVVFVSADVTLCGGGCTTLSATSPNDPNVSYFWNPTNQTGSSITVCPTVSTTYVIVATDGVGCQNTATINVNVIPAPPITIIAAANSTICEGSCDTLFAISSNDPNYNYIWNPTATPGPVLTICPTANTIYNVTGTDPTTGCTATATIEVIVNPLPVLTLSVTNVTCFGGSDGCISATSTGGTFVLNPNGLSNNSGIFCGLPAGTYSITYTDANGCTTQATASIAEPTTLALSLFSDNIPPCCPILTVSGGTPTYSYLWSNGVTLMQPCPPQLPDGIYTVTVTDANGCTATATVLINCNPCPPLIVNFSDECNGTVCANISGGCPPYAYMWNTTPVSTTSCVTGIPPCTIITLTVFDANGNAITVTRQKADLAATITNADCPLGNNGAIDLHANCISTFCSPLSYMWSNGVINEDLTGLSEGTYCVTITDNCGNTYTCCFDVGCSCDTVCYDFNDNNIHGFVADPTNPNLTVVLSNNGQNGAGDFYVQATDLPFGSLLMAGPEFVQTYCCGTLCFDYRLINDGDPNQVINTSPTLYIRNGADIFGFAFNNQVNENSGWNTFCVPFSGPECALPPTSPNGQWIAIGNTLMSSWSTVMANVTGVYFRVDFTTSTEITGFDNVCFTPSGNQVNAGPDLTICAGQSVTLTAQGCSGTAIWHTITGTTSVFSGQTITDIPQQSTCYVVICGDTACCGSTDTVCVTVLPLPVVNITVYDAHCGGTGGFSFNTPHQWVNIIPCYSGNCPFYTSNFGLSVNNYPPGTYDIIITDTNGCSITVTRTIANIPGPDVDVSYGLALLCCDDSTDFFVVFSNWNYPPYTIDVYSNLNLVSPIYSYSGVTSSSPNVYGGVAHNVPADKLPKGTYIIIVTDAYGCTTTKTLVITGPDCIEATITVDNNTNPCCPVLIVTGGTPNYNYLWSNSSVNSQLACPPRLPNGTYTVTVTDALGCTGTASVTINCTCDSITDSICINPDMDAILSSLSPTTNFNTYPGFTATGWTVSGTPMVLRGLMHFNLSAIPSGAVIDAAILNLFAVDIIPGTIGSEHNCLSGNNNAQLFFLNMPWNSATVTWNSYNSNVQTVTPAPKPLGPLCNPLPSLGYSPDVSINLLNWTTQWHQNPTSNFGIGFALNNENFYRSMVFGSNDWPNAAQRPQLCISYHMPLVQLKYKINCDTSLCIVPSGGCTNIYTYIWNDGITTACRTYSPCTSYTVAVTDECGCTNSLTITPPPFWFTEIKPHCNNSDGTICIYTDTCNGNSNFYPPFTYQWSSNIPNATNYHCQGNVPKGTYTVTVTDINGNKFECSHELKCTCPWEGCIQKLTSPGYDYFKAKTTHVYPVGCQTYYWSDNSQNPHNTMYDFASNTNPFYYPAIPPIGYPQLQYPLHLTVISCCGDTVHLTYSPIQIVLQGNNPCCNANDGSISIVSVTGGSDCVPGGSAYTYTWQKNTGTWVNIASPNNLSAGTYRLKVTDCCGNIKYSNNVTIGAYVPFTITAKKSTPSDCAVLTNIYNGTISFKVSSTCAPVTYGYSYMPFPNCTCLPNGISYAQQPLLVDVNNVATFNFMAPGTYTFFVERCGVLYQFSIVVHFKKPTIKFHFTNCNTNVCIETNACCNPTFTWLKNNVVYGNQTQCRSIGSGLNKLHAGTTYVAKVTDCEGQLISRSIKIPTDLTALQNDNCDAGTGAIISNLINFGTGLTYVWTTSNGQSGFPRFTKDISGLLSGTFCVTITNSNGDRWECCYTITNVSPAITFVTATGACRSNCITVLTGTPFAGNNPYNITWSPCGVTSSIHFGPCYDQCGCYDVFVSDAAGCTASAPVNIAGVKINQTSNCTLCADICGGCTPYSYLWSNSQTTQCISCATSGTYTVTVTDCNGLTYTCSKTITVAPIQCQVIAISPVIQVKVSGGCPTYSCVWSVNGNGPILSQGGSDPYTFEFNNPSSNDTYNMFFYDDCGHSCIPFQFNARNGFTGGNANQLLQPIVAPNPNEGTFSIFFEDNWLTQSLNYTVHDVTGRLVADGKINVSTDLQYKMNLTNLPKGIYLLEMSNETEKWTEKIIIK